jgi:hypothetical protein
MDLQSLFQLTLPRVLSLLVEFLYFTASRPALGSAQFPIQRVPGTLSPGLKRPGREGDQSPPSSAEVKKGGAISPLPHMSSWHGASLMKLRDKFTITFHNMKTKKER